MEDYRSFVGFETRPADLEGFLRQQGYAPEGPTDQTRVKFVYTGPTHVVDIYFYPFGGDITGEPDWGIETGKNITSKLVVYTDVIRSLGELLRIGRRVTKEFNGVLYDDGEFVEIQDPKPDSVEAASD